MGGVLISIWSVVAGFVLRGLKDILENMKRDISNFI